MGKWIDGSLIYRKSFSGTTILPGAHGITGLKDVLEIEAFVKNTGDGSWRPIPWLFNTLSNTDWMAGVSVGPANFSWQVGTQIGAFTQNRVTIYYTKTV